MTRLESYAGQAVRAVAVHGAVDIETPVAGIVNPEPEVLRELLEYDAASGCLFWKERGPELFKDGSRTPEHSSRSWNSRYAGKPAFTADDGSGYLVGAIFGQRHNSHRVIWAMVYGEWPEMVDHINGDRKDNRLVNLRSVSPGENARNSAISKLNRTGVAGVAWRTRDAKWRAHIGFKRKHIHLGYFENFEDAVSARKQAEIRFGFHRNHGRLPVNGGSDA